MLTNKQLESFKAQEEVYKKSDGKGLYIWIATTGIMSWQYRYQIMIKGKRTDRVYTIGKYPELSLKQARTQHTVLRADVQSGLDVQLLKMNSRKIKPKSSSKTSFKAVALEYIEYRKKQVGETTWNKDLSRLNRFVFPVFGNTLVTDLTTMEILTHMNKIAETNGRETAQRTVNQIASVLKYAMATNRVQNNVAVGLSEYLPKPEVINRKAILDETMLGQYIYTVENNDSSKDLVGCALRLMPHIFVRHSEMLAMKWSEIDWKKKTWTFAVSKTRTSGVKEHIVFLSEQVIKILKDCQDLTGNEDKVFHGGDKQGQISQRAVGYRLRELGFDKDTVSFHGFRATARTLGEDKLQFDSRVLETCLAHRTREALGTAYDRTKRLEDRQKFYIAYSDMLIDCKKMYQKTKIKSVK